MEYKLFDWLDEMHELEEELTKNGQLEVGDPNLQKYNALRDEFLKRFMPSDEEEFIDFVRDIKEDYESWLEGGIERVKGELEPQIKDLQERLKSIASAVSPYLDNLKKS